MPANLAALVLSTVLSTEVNRRFTFDGAAADRAREYLQNAGTVAFYAVYGSAVLLLLEQVVGRSDGAAGVARRRGRERRRRAGAVRRCCATGCSAGGTSTRRRRPAQWRCDPLPPPARPARRARRSPARHRRRVRHRGGAVGPAGDGGADRREPGRLGRETRTTGRRRRRRRGGGDDERRTTAAAEATVHRRGATPAPGPRGSATVPPAARVGTFRPRMDIRPPRVGTFAGLTTRGPRASPGRRPAAATGGSAAMFLRRRLPRSAAPCSLAC